MARQKWSWTQFQIDKLNKVRVILDELSEYKPLTLRQMYYQLVGKGYIDNKKSEYISLSNLLKHARLDSYISWDDVEDRVRVYSDLSGWQDRQSFVNYAIDRLVKSYSRDLWQSQGKYVEVWIEKDALSSIFRRICSQYGVSVVVCRGFSSISFLHDYCIRLVKYGHKEPVMLYFGDFDPSGNEMLESMKITLRYEMNVKNVQYKRIALMKDDIFKYSLPHDPDALKKSDTRANKHIDAYGELAVELDALPPDALKSKIENAIEDEIDNVEAFNHEFEMYNADIHAITELREQIVGLSF